MLKERGASSGRVQELVGLTEDKAKSVIEAMETERRASLEEELRTLTLGQCDVLRAAVKKDILPLAQVKYDEHVIVTASFF